MEKKGFFKRMIVITYLNFSQVHSSMLFSIILHFFESKISLSEGGTATFEDLTEGSFSNLFAHFELVVYMR